MARIDNSKPDAYLDVSSPAATTCGDLLLTSDRTITFRVTAHHAQGHMNYLQIWGNRGRYAETAGGLEETIGANPMSAQNNKGFGESL